MLTFNTYYHIYNHANGDENLFRERKNYGFFLKKYRQHINPVADTIAWCLMPNHFHLLVRTKSEVEIAKVSTNFSKVSNFGKVGERGKVEERKKVEEVKAAKSKFLSKQFSNLFSSYTQAFNKVYGRHGSLFLKNFKRKEIEEEAYLRNLILYIHLNPVKHGFTHNVVEWEHSSYAAFPEREPDFLIRFFGDNENYQFLHQQSDFDEYENMENHLTQ